MHLHMLLLHIIVNNYQHLVTYITHIVLVHMIQI